MLTFSQSLFAARNPFPRKLIGLGVLTFFLVILVRIMVSQSVELRLLSDPFLQFPKENSVRVVWFTEFSGSQHFVSYGEALKQRVSATTTQLTRTREDQQSQLVNQQQPGQFYPKPTARLIWRHEAEVTGLTPGVKLPYQVTSMTENQQEIKSAIFSLSPQPLPGTPLKILLTSDHQLKPMVAANLQKVGETIPQLDAIFFAGDLVNIPDRASEWFDDARGNAFFPTLQGKAHYKSEKNNVTTTYKGTALIQNIPLFPALGNHEVMGAFLNEKDLNQQFYDAYPRFAVETLYQQQAEAINPHNDPKFKEEWIKNRSYNSDTYQEIFSLPEPNQIYYAVSFGDIRLIVLSIANLWGIPRLDPDVKGKYREKEADFNQPENWGYGQVIFEAIAKGSEQYNWLEKELNKAEFKQAKYKIVMFHHPPHSLGENIVPPYTDPVQVIEKNEQDHIKMIRYEYPIEQDYIIRDVVPLLEKAGVQFVYYGHSHLWNRFVSPSGMHFLESSNVGNSHGAYVGNKKRSIPAGLTGQYSAVGNPNGLNSVIPTINPILGDNQEPLGYISSNDLTVFSILDTGTETISSYYFDTSQPDSTVIKFDEFQLKGI